VNQAAEYVKLIGVDAVNKGGLTKTCGSFARIKAWAHRARAAGCAEDDGAGCSPA
jgi:hypothetical protein